MEALALQDKRVQGRCRTLLNSNLTIGNDDFIAWKQDMGIRTQLFEGRVGGVIEQRPKIEEPIFRGDA